MIGFVIVTHNQIGKEMTETVEEILTEKINFRTISVIRHQPFAETQRSIYNAVRDFDSYDGVIILTDLFGATPSNLCKEFLSNGKVEMITGCNLPMLLKAASTTFTQSPSQVAQFLRNYGKENIQVYSTD